MADFISLKGTSKKTQLNSKTVADKTKMKKFLSHSSACQRSIESHVLRITFTVLTHPPNFSKIYPGHDEAQSVSHTHQVMFSHMTINL